MAEQQIIEWAREVGVGCESLDGKRWILPVGVECLISLVAAHAKAEERERCASVVENAHTPDCGGWNAQGIADAIRALKD